MTPKAELPKSLPEEIYGEFFARLEADPSNDRRMILALRSCLSDGAIGDRKRIQASVADALNEEISE